ncbi:MAG: restriction endonuclease [Fimbriimonas sp.]
METLEPGQIFGATFLTAYDHEIRKHSCNHPVQSCVCLPAINLTETLLKILAHRFWQTLQPTEQQNSHGAPNMTSEYSEYQRRIAQHIARRLGTIEAADRLNIPYNAIEDWMKSSTVARKPALDETIHIPAFEMLPAKSLQAAGFKCLSVTLQVLKSLAVNRPLLSFGDLPQRILSLLGQCASDETTSQDSIRATYDLQKEIWRINSTLDRTWQLMEFQFSGLLAHTLFNARSPNPEYIRIIHLHASRIFLYLTGTASSEIERFFTQIEIDLLEEQFREGFDEGSELPTSEIPPKLSTKPVTPFSLEHTTLASLPDDQIRQLPDHGLLSVASRQVLRICHELPKEISGEAVFHIGCLQSVSEHGYGDHLPGLANKILSLTNMPSEKAAVAERSGQGYAMKALRDLGKCVWSVWADDYEHAEKHFHSSMVFANGAAHQSGYLLDAEGLNDVNAAYSYAFKPGAAMKPFDLVKDRSWRRPFPQTLFADYLFFDLQQNVMGSSIATISELVTDELLSRVAQSPNLLYRMEPRRFEELISYVLELYGFEVELTTQTRDGGKDIVAISCEHGYMKFLIECKRYKKSNKVGIEIVQRLHGVVHGDQGTRGILVTTSSLSSDARKYVDRPHVGVEIEVRDFQGLHRWLQLADRIAVTRRLAEDDRSRLRQ